MAKDIEIAALADQVRSIIKNTHDVTGGACGIAPVAIMREVAAKWELLEPVLKQLHQEKYFRIRKGINGQLYFYNKSK